MNNSKGVTMVELMVTLAILTLFATIAFPTFGPMVKKARLKQAGRDMVTNFQRARIGALKEGRSWRVTFDTANKKYTVIDSGADGTFGTDDDITMVTVNISNYKNVEFGVVKQLEDFTIPDDGVSFNSNMISFRANGNCSAAGTVYFKDDENHGFAVGVNNLAGRIKSWALWNPSGNWES